MASIFRASTSRGAEAIMAALEVSYSSERVLPAASEELGPGGLPISLLNLLLALEGCHSSILYMPLGANFD